MAETAPTLLEALQAHHSLPLWDRFKQLLTPTPQYFQPMAWRWSDMAPLVERASREVSMADAERRVLLLTHPGFPGTVFTTPTLSCGLQILDPGEEAGAHRHTVAAIRMVMTGSGAQTITDGKVCAMEPGDLILTPAWTWHEHRHLGDERMVWFDGLDFPLARSLGSIFVEPGPGALPDRGMAAWDDSLLSEGGVLPEGTAPAGANSPLYRYPWTSVRRVLEAMPAQADGSRQVRYVNPADGGPVMPTIDCYALRPGIGQPTRRARSTATAIAVVIEGEGRSAVGDEVIDWRPHDVFTLPRWQWVEHLAAQGPATLFLMTDRSLMDRIGYLRDEQAEPAP